MIGGLLRLILIVVLVVGVLAFFVGYNWTDSDEPLDVDRPVGTSGTLEDDVDIDTSRAREVGADVGERVATGVDQAQRGLAEAGLTGKIKAKMALDDIVKARSIDVDTAGTVVTLTGRVWSEAERMRAVQLAQETEGVTSVVDRLTVAAP